MQCLRCGSLLDPSVQSCPVCGAVQQAPSGASGDPSGGGGPAVQPAGVPAHQPGSASGAGGAGFLGLGAQQQPGAEGQQPPSVPAPPRIPAPESGKAGAGSAGSTGLHGARLVAVVLVLVLVLVAILGAVAWLLRGGRTGAGLGAGRSPEGVPETVSVDSVKDPGLQASLKALDKDGDGTLTLKERLTVSSLTVNGALSVKGVGAVVPKLTSLTLRGGKASAVDVSDLPALTALDASAEPVATLDVSHNPKLTSLKVADQTLVTGVDKVPGLTQVWLLTRMRAENWDPSGGYHCGGGAAESSAGDYTWTTTWDDAARPLTDEMRGDEPSGIDSDAYTYGEDGRLSTWTRQSPGADETWSFTYDGDRIVRAVGEGLNGQEATEAEYDASGRLVSVSHNGDVMTASYDDTGRLTQLTGYESLTGLVMRTWSYDASGKVVRGSIDSAWSSRATEYSYDDAGRVVTETVSPGARDSCADRGEWTISNEYDTDGRLVRVTEADAQGSTVTAREYGEVGPVITERTDDGATVAYTYERRFVARDTLPSTAGLVVEDVPGGVMLRATGVWLADLPGQDKVSLYGI